MLNLLNRQRRHFLRREYLGRFFNVSLIIILAALIYYGVLLASNIFLINLEKGLVEKQTALIESSDSQKKFEEYEKDDQHLKAEYTLFSEKRIFIEKLLNKISEKEVKGLSLQEIFFAKDGDDAKINLRGDATDRQVLLKYINNYKTDVFFKNLDNPFSNLTKNNNIPFTISANFTLESYGK